MAVTSIMTTEGEIVSKEGANVSTSLTDAMHDAWVLQAENFVNVFARQNFSDAVTAGLNADVKGIFSDIVSSLVAIRGIMYDMSGYGRNTAEDMVNELRDGIHRNLAELRDKKSQDFITGA